MRKLIIFMIIIQILLIAIGILQIYFGKTAFGIVNVVMNFSFMLLNFRTLKLIRQTDEYLKLAKQESERLQKLIDEATIKFKIR